MRISIWAQRRSARAIAALVAAAALTGGTAAIAPRLSASTHHTAMRASLAGNDTECAPQGTLPVTTGGFLPAPGDCTGTPAGPMPQVPAGQQGQQCQLTEEQQNELVTRAQDQQAAADHAFQSALLKNLLALAGAKANAELALRLYGYTELSPQDVASLIQDGSVTPADMAMAILQTLQELGESSGDAVIDTCAGNQGGTPSTGAGDPWFSDSADDTTPTNDQQLAAVEQQFNQENWTSLTPAELGQKIADAIGKWVTGRTRAICDLVTMANLSPEAAAEAVNVASVEAFGATGGISQIGNFWVVPEAVSPKDPAAAIAIAPDGTVTPAVVTNVSIDSTGRVIATNLRLRT